ncbi:MAG: polysaccharide deacetylase family protein [Clostridia bacterium]|nr:polysaccharide deacetylase family protein [Clostridia bacterium]
MSIPQYETITESTIQNTTESTTEKQTNSPETTVTPEPMAERIYSNEKIAHSYGVAKNGVVNEISINAQKFFETNKFNAFCLDTKSKEKVLYLTFDCGYENGYTSKILDTLKEKNVNAAFFCTLPQVKENPELIKRMIDEGHIVGNHSVTHPSFAEISTDQMITEVKGMEEYLQKNFNYSEPYFRFPKGEYNEVALNQINKLGYTCVFWSLAYADWDLNNQKGKNYAYEKVVSRLHPGAVILLHSVSPDNASALSDIIDEARRQGYKFLSLRDYN